MRNNDPFADLIRSLEENLEREGGGGRPPIDVGRPVRTAGSPRRWLWIIIPLLLLIFFFRSVGFYADWIWYNSLGLASVFVTRIQAALGLFAVAALVFWLFLALNVWLAHRLEPYGLADTPFEQIANAFGLRVLPVILVIGAVLAFFMGLAASGAWEDILVYLNHGVFNLTVPIFNRDVSFFMFTLPIWEDVRGWLMFMGVVTLLATALVAGVGWRGARISTPVLVHLSILGAMLLLLVAWQYRLDAYDLAYSERGVVLGAGYTDVHAQLPAYNLLSIITVLTAVLLVVTAFLRRTWRVIVVLLVAWVIVAVVAGSLYPSLVQRFKVSPNELSLEKPYIGTNIQFTRAAFDLDKIEAHPYKAGNQLTANALVNAPETVQNIRLWDYRPLLQTYNQVQALTQYYDFNDVDIDRYVINGKVQQVMLAARELVPDRLNADAQTWINRKLVYTHGYGAAVSPVAQVAGDGLPQFLLKDLPVQGVITVTQPQIYFGELTNDYVIVNTDQAEFDYPQGETKATTNFAANTGIKMGIGARLLFALNFADINLLLNGDISSNSKLLWRRNITERVREVAPFLRYDADPYLVIGDDGRMYWFLDAYTTSDRFPYGELANLANANLANNDGAGDATPINYMRNSVKVVMNAYDGAMKFYVMDDKEPIIAAYQRIFPALFTPFSAMPAGLKAHIRYPTDLFTVEAQIYRIYHMTDPNEFYNKEDVWAWPQEVYNNQTQPVEPYYVLMQLPESKDLDFVQILPFTPANRENMIAWLATQNDPAKYGQKLVYEFGKDALVYGPKQIEARIDQDPVISQQLSLWNQQGSSVIRGNLLIIPLGGSLLYVEPLYLQSTSSNIPELKRVIIATSERVVMGDNLGLALAGLFGQNVLNNPNLSALAGPNGQAAANGTAKTTPSASAPNATGASSANVTELIIQASTVYSEAQTSLRNGDWAGYGKQMDTLRTTLEQLMTLTGAQTKPATAPPAATATPGK
ncbi:MAG: UPF0182 family protein [Caldilineaceae bacterium]